MCFQVRMFVKQGAPLGSFVEGSLVPTGQGN